MSYKIDGVEVISNENARISKTDLQAAKEACGDEIPESSLFDMLDERNQKYLPTARYDSESDCFILEKSFWWSGECSGRTYETLLMHVLPKIQGTLELMFVWEHGDSYSGVRVVDGKVTQHEVEFKLGKERSGRP